MTEEGSGTRLRVAVAEEVRVLLTRRRLSGVQLANKMGRSTAYVSRRLTGDTAFDVDDLEVIARELGVSVRDLFAGTGPQTTGPKLRPAKVPPSLPERLMTEKTAGCRPTGLSPRSRATPNTRRPVRL